MGPLTFFSAPPIRGVALKAVENFAFAKKKRRRDPVNGTPIPTRTWEGWYTHLLLFIHLKRWVLYKVYNQLGDLDLYYSMGLCAAKNNVIFVEDATRPGQSPQAVNMMKNLGIHSTTIQKLFQKFCDINTDGSGEISLDQFYEALKDLERSPFSDRVFSICDADGSGQIDFCEFVIAIWNFCSFGHSSMLKFAFQLYDLDGSGTLEVTEIGALIGTVYGKPFDTDVRVKRIMEKIDTNGDGIISFGEFVAFNKKYPVLLFPAFSMQQVLRKLTFGDAFWAKETARRQKQFGGQRESNIFELLVKMNAQTFKDELGELMGALDVRKGWSSNTYVVADGKD